MLPIRQTPAGVVTTDVMLDGQVRSLSLHRHSVRAAGFQLLVQGDDGSLVAVAPGPVSTLRGEIDGLPGSVVAASLTNEGLRAKIVLPDDTTYWVEPSAGRIASARAGEHLVYRGDNVMPSGGTCAMATAAVDNGAIATTSGTSGTVSAAGGLFLAELLIDTDYEFFLSSSSDAQTVVDRIESIINGVNVQFERDVAIRHVITRIVVRSSPNDPYADIPSDADALLSKFQDVWRFSSERRDLAQLFTGRQLAGSTIGIAFVGFVCSSGFGYSLVEGNCSSCSTVACRTDLSAHELGHNWDAIHCGDAGPGDPSPCSPSCPGFTMNCSLQCANQFHSLLTVPDIITERDLKAPICLDQGDELIRLILAVDPPGTTSINEGDSVQFAATANFRFGADQDVTTLATWSVDRPQAGSIDTVGLFTAFDVVGDTCITISATYTSEGIQRTNTRTIIIVDLDQARAFVQSDPTDGAIDARQPSDPNGRNTAGWRFLDLMYNGDVCMLTAADFVSTELGDDGIAPLVVNLQNVGDRAIRLVLLSTADACAWTTVTDTTIGASIAFAVLAGDVDGDGIADTADVVRLIDSLIGSGAALPVWSTDIDRSDLTAPPDILRLIDLHNGAGVYEVCPGRQLPP